MHAWPTTIRRRGQHSGTAKGTGAGDSGTRQPVKQTPEETGTVVTETFNLITIMITITMTITITIAITITLMIMLAQESKAIIEMKSAEAK